MKVLAEAINLKMGNKAMPDKVTTATIINSVEAECREGTFGENTAVKRILEQIQSLGRMDNYSSKRVYPITIGGEDGSDYITIDGLKIGVSLRVDGTNDKEPRRAWLNSGMSVNIQHIRGRSFKSSSRYRVFVVVDDGGEFCRDLRKGEVIWVDEDMFRVGFYLSGLNYLRTRRVVPPPFSGCSGLSYRSQ